MGVRGQLLFAAIVAGCILVFPILRGSGLVPVDTLVSWSSAISQDRAESLAFRFRNEDILLARANEKPLSGWGGYGRNRVFDDETGRDVSVTDGMWIITIGTWGWIGYISQFGLLIIPTIFLAVRRRELEVSYATAGLALMLAANLLDMIPNATLTPVTWLIGGALAGRYSLAMAAARRRPPRSARPGTARTPARARSRAGAGDGAGAAGRPHAPGAAALRAAGLGSGQGLLEPARGLVPAVGGHALERGVGHRAPARGVEIQHLGQPRAHGGRIPHVDDEAVDAIADHVGAQPVRVATTGQRQAIASRIGRPKPSDRLPAAKTSHIA